MSTSPRLPVVGVTSHSELVRDAVRALATAALAADHVPPWQGAHQSRQTARRSQKVAAAVTTPAII